MPRTKKTRELTEKSRTEQSIVAEAVTLKALRDILVLAEAEWKVRPLVTLACGGYADAHWQIFHPDHLEFPVYIILDDGKGKVDLHPDGPDI